MSNYTVIADAGTALVQLLRKELVPDIVKNSTSIGLASPADKGDMVICVHLYDVSESEVYRVSGMISESVDTQKFPPVYLTLSYLITVFSASDVKFRSQDEQRILGKVAQVLRDHPTMNPDTMEFDTESGEDRIRVEMIKADADEKSKAWSFPNQAPRLSLFYRIGPVALESARTKNVPRVQEMEFKKENALNPFAKIFRRDREK
ncbi:MAG: DUF4255 domain-containing protein [Lachnospiraceae bacterium]|nr:DUF4255 domain-containing protein [Lachnospiraceae bacterium]